MERPCTCNRVRLGQPYDIGQDCRLGDVPPKHFSSDRVHVADGNPIIERSRPGWARIGSNGKNLCGGQLAPPLSFAFAGRSVFYPVGHVFGVRSPIQIFGTIIGRVAVSVAGFFPVRASPRECEKDEPVDVKNSMLAIYGRGDDRMTILSDERRKDFALDLMPMPRNARHCSGSP